MSEERFRVSVVVILAVAAVVMLGIAYGWSQNGRYVQYDLNKQGQEPYVIDTRTGKLHCPTKTWPRMGE